MSIMLIIVLVAFTSMNIITTFLPPGGVGMWKVLAIRHHTLLIGGLSSVLLAALMMGNNSQTLVTVSLIYGGINGLVGATMAYYLRPKWEKEWAKRCEEESGLLLRIQKKLIKPLSEEGIALIERERNIWGKTPGQWRNVFSPKRLIRVWWNQRKRGKR